MKYAPFLTVYIMETRDIIYNSQKEIITKEEMIKNLKYKEDIPFVQYTHHTGTYKTTCWFGNSPCWQINGYILIEDFGKLTDDSGKPLFFGSVDTSFVLTEKYVEYSMILYAKD